MILFDSHAHLCDDKIWFNRWDIFQKMHERGCHYCTLMITNEQDFERALVLEKEIEENFSSLKIVFSAATGPNEVYEQDESFFPTVAHLAEAGKLSAIGETGLDYHWNTTSHDRQKTAFIRYLDLARKWHLPVVIHCRRAFDDLVDILKNHYIGKQGAVAGVFHCFAEGLEEAKKVVDFGFMLSISGIVTYNSAKNVQEVAAWVDSKSYLVETDSPYLTPGKNRSQINDPSKLILVAEKVAQLRGQSLEEVAACSFANAKRLFKLN